MNALVEFLQAAIVTDRQIQNQYPEMYYTFSSLETMIQDAWDNWDLDITKPYFDGDKKPEEPPIAFKLDWVYDTDFEADGYDIKEMLKIFGIS